MSYNIYIYIYILHLLHLIYVTLYLSIIYYIFYIIYDIIYVIYYILDLTHVEFLESFCLKTHAKSVTSFYKLAFPFYKPAVLRIVAA